MRRLLRRCAWRGLPAIALLGAVGCRATEGAQTSAAARAAVIAEVTAGHAPVRPRSGHDEPQSLPQERTPSLAAPSTVAAKGSVTSQETAEVGVSPLKLEPATVQGALATIPVLAGLADGFKAFSASDADAALRRGGRGRDGILLYTFLPSAFAWSPEKGKALWVLSGRSGARALIAVIRPLADGTFSHAASTVIEEPDTTVAVGYNAEHPEQLLWTTCYGCAGEGGTIRLQEDGRVEFTYR